MSEKKKKKDFPKEIIKILTCIYIYKITTEQKINKRRKEKTASETIYFSKI